MSLSGSISLKSWTRPQWRVSGKNGAAEILGLKPTTLESRMAKLGINREGIEFPLFRERPNILGRTSSDTLVADEFSRLHKSSPDSGLHVPRERRFSFGTNCAFCRAGR